MLAPKDIESLTTLRVGTSPSIVTVCDGPYVIYTDFGYIPVLHVKVDKSGVDYILPIAARSLAKAIKPLSDANSSFKGLRLSIRKESEEKTSKYIVSAL